MKVLLARHERPSLGTTSVLMRRHAHPRYSVLDNTRLPAAFGTMPPWQDALDRYLRAKGHRNT